jgi:predicted DNA-binding protein (MmcQ/YjbR family)
MRFSGFEQMNVDVLRKFCLSFPQAKENVQWDDDLCFKVGGKIFAVLDLKSVPPAICFKCDPEKFAELTEREGIVPAPYVGRYKWALVESLDVLERRELEELLGESYRMVAAKLPRPKRAVRGKRGKAGLS